MGRRGQARTPDTAKLRRGETRPSRLLNDRGHLAKDPLHQVVRDDADHIRLLARELGSTPAARASLQLVPVADLPDIDAELGPPPRLRVVGSADG